MNNFDKWLVIHTMVKEKFIELERAINLIDHYRGGYKKTGAPKLPPIAEVKYLIKKEFLTHKVQEYVKLKRSTWFENLSTENLLRLYSYLNFVLRRFYYLVEIDVEFFTNKYGVKDYKLKRVDTGEHVSSKDIFDEFMSILKIRIKEGIDKDCLWVGKINGIEQLNQKPAGIRSKGLDVFDEETRNKVVAEVISSCIAEVEDKTGQKVSFKLAVQGRSVGENKTVGGVRLGSWVNPRTRFGLNKENIVDPKEYDDDLDDRLISRILVGINENYEPIYLDKNTHSIYNAEGMELPEDIFYTPIERVD